jgi:hypothetical protein
MTKSARAAMLKARFADARAYEQVFASPDGKRVLYDILRAGGLLTISHVPGDPYSTEWNDGRRSLALHIVDQLRWNEAELVKLAQMQTDEDVGMMDATYQ